MLAELHEGLGVAALACVAAAVALGAAAYRFQWVKGFLPLKRPTLIKLHLWLALGFLAAMTFHYLIAPRVHGAQQAGALALVVAFLLGFSLRLSRNHFQLAIKAKIALVVVAAVLLPAGHWLVGETKHEGRESRAQGGRPTVAATVSPPWDAGS